MRMPRRTMYGNRAKRLLLAVAGAGVLAASTRSPVVAQRADPTGGEVVRVVAYNIKHGRGMDDRVDLERIARVLERLDADVVMLQEVDDRTERTGGVDQAGVLAGLLGYQAVHGPHRPYQGGYYGNAILSRFPVLSSETVAIPPASGSALAVLVIEVALGSGRSASFVSVHLAGTVEERLRQASSLTTSLEARPHPVVLAGDLNGRPDGPVLRLLRQDWVVLPKTGSGDTYPADRPDREIDFVLVRNRDRVEVIDHHVVPEAIASDHRPILAVLRLLPEPTPPAEDRERR